MKIERLRNKKIMLIFLCGFLVVVILLITLVFKGSKSKYRNSQIIPLINTKVKNNVPSFTTMGIYLEDSTGTETKNGKKYKIQETIPNEGYVINETNSYCTLFNSTTNTSETVTDKELKLYTDILGNHSIKGIKKGYKCYIYFDKGTNKFMSAKYFLLGVWGYEDISTITERTDFTTTIEGRDPINNKDYVYKAEDDDGTSYYLAGNPANNWVKFGGHYWRIVRINGDNSIRMIYSGSNETGPQKEGNSTTIGLSPFNYENSNNEYAGYFYKLGEQRGLENASKAYNEINTFYISKLENYSNYIDKNAGFCNDRSLMNGSGIGTNGMSFGKWSLTSSSALPTYKCDNTDLFTAKVSTKGNKVLANPIGMITADEVAMGGLRTETAIVSKDNMFINSSYYWTLTPSRNYGGGVCVFFVRSGGAIGSGNRVTDSFGLRPVINLVKDIKFSKGNGSISSPFEI